VEDETEIMKHDEIIAGHLSPCVQIFIQSLLNAELTTDVARDTDTRGNSMDIKKGAERPTQVESGRLGDHETPP
jgi:hypothetical protein